MRQRISIDHSSSPPFVGENHVIELAQMCGTYCPHMDLCTAMNHQKAMCHHTQSMRTGACTRDMTPHSNKSRYFRRPHHGQRPYIFDKRSQIVQYPILMFLHSVQKICMLCNMRGAGLVAIAPERGSLKWLNDIQCASGPLSRFYF